jgi:hypothetical protein
MYSDYVVYEELLSLLQDLIISVQLGKILLYLFGGEVSLYISTKLKICNEFKHQSDRILILLKLITVMFNSVYRT